MTRLHRIALTLALLTGAVGTAQASPYLCTYTITNGGYGVYPVDATDQGDALTQASAFIYATYGPVGYQLQCHAE